MAAETATGVPLELIGLLTPLPADGGPVPGEVVEHEVCAVGHAAVLLAGDMLSDVLIPLLDPRRTGQQEAYEAALELLGKAAEHVAARFATDRAYLEALRRGEEPADERWGKRR
ncbi:hypothetical protein H4696_005553 [Amycolatopsis lexingtonensis]|uniref:Uncharacterized protein n=1 Tax=Amycolatopsis lexingtonensis TaxID=218822 RepID=A0ABR9I5Q2_9PSEU|nr:hypothetical protein [Amycolatopsis lexingtonensis]MBE1498453.1 hypothetical protein [Amycolatopsis lexingtonensis]